MKCFRMLCFAFALVWPSVLAAEDFDALYDEIADDLKRGQPLVIAAHYGMWFENAATPERNINWHGRLAHATMMKRARRDKHIRKAYRYWRWHLVHESKAPAGAVRTLVFRQTVRPSRRWQRRGVVDTFETYLVMQAWPVQTEAGLAMVQALRQERGQQITTDNGVTLDTGRAQIVGYFGHNFFYDFPDFGWDGLDRVEGDVRAARGIFAVGCRTGNVPGFNRVLGRNVYGVLLSKHLMASEGQSTLALTDGVLRGYGGRDMARFANDTYQSFRRIGAPDRRVGRPFISHGDVVGLPVDSGER